MEAMTFGTDMLKAILFCRNEARPSGNTGGLVPEYNERNRKKYNQQREKESETAADGIKHFSNGIDQRIDSDHVISI